MTAATMIPKQLGLRALWRWLYAEPQRDQLRAYYRRDGCLFQNMVLTTGGWTAAVPPATRDANALHKLERDAWWWREEIAAGRIPDPAKALTWMLKDIETVLSLAGRVPRPHVGWRVERGGRGGSGGET